MDIEKIEKFIDAGYTKEEIAKLLETDESASKEQPKEQPKEQDEADKAHEGAINTSTDEAIKALTATVESLTSTVKAMQDANIKSAKGGKDDGLSIEETMKSFIETI